MDESLFVERDGAFQPTAHSRGPWSPDALHGGPVAALLAHELSAAPTAGPMFPARLTIELLRPVALEPMAVETSVVRPGRKVQVLEARLHRNPDEARSAETLVARATLQQIRDLPLAMDGVGRLDDPTTEVARPESLPSAPMAFDDSIAFHSRAVDLRNAGSRAAGLTSAGGPATCWIRVTVDLLPDLPLAPLEAVMAAADFGNGISSSLPYPDFLFVNPDLTVTLERLPVDGWVGLDASTHYGPHGTAVAETLLFDREGRLGRGVQTLLVERVD
jgi:acyl-coenzyme A thioesterase PaaI-like protein